VRSRAKADHPKAAVVAAVAAVWLAPALARAEVVYDLAPSASVGYTDNARLTSAALSDEFSILAAAARARYLGVRANHTLGYRLAWTKYFQGNGIDNLSNDMIAQLNFNLTPVLELHINGNATLSRVSRPPLGDPATALPPQGLPAGNNDLFLSTGASEELVYHWNARWQYTEAVGATRVTYLETPAPPNALSLNARARADLTTGVEGYSLEASALGSIGTTNSLIATLMAGWHREISVTLTGELQAGVMGIFLDNASPVIGPSGNATLGYRRLTWFATVNVSRIPAANLFLGQATVNNQATVRLTLPLTRDEMAVVSGVAGYVYANPVNDQFTRAFDQRIASVMLGSRLGRLPLYGSLEYSVLSQHNNPDVPTPAPNLFRQLVMLNLGALFTFGPGTPPILGAPI
jgi:hypothetical protein